MIPPKVQVKADAVLSSFIAGEIQARKGTFVNYLTLEVGYRYRWLCWKPEACLDPSSWSLHTHEAYNKLTRRPR